MNTEPNDLVKLLAALVISGLCVGLVQLNLWHRRTRDDKSDAKKSEDYNVW